MITCHLSWASSISWACKGLMKFTDTNVRPNHQLGRPRQSQRAKRARGRKAGWEEVLNQNRSCDRTESKKEPRPPSEAVQHTSQASRGRFSGYCVRGRTAPWRRCWPVKEHTHCSPTPGRQLIPSTLCMSLGSTLRKCSLPTQHRCSRGIVISEAGRDRFLGGTSLSTGKKKIHVQI